MLTPIPSITHIAYSLSVVFSVLNTHRRTTETCLRPAAIKHAHSVQIRKAFQKVQTMPAAYWPHISLPVMHPEPNVLQFGTDDLPA